MIQFRRYFLLILELSLQTAIFTLAFDVFGFFPLESFLFGVAFALLTLQAFRFFLNRFPLEMLFDIEKPIEPFSFKRKALVFSMAFSLIAGGLVIPEGATLPVSHLFEEATFQKVAKVSEGSLGKKFPKEPSHRQGSFEAGGRVIQYDEYFFTSSDEKVTYTLIALPVPRSALKWGSTLILNGLIGPVADHEGHKRYKESSGSKSGGRYVEYSATSDKYRHHVRLILKDGVLYKLELRYPLGEIEENQELAKAFFDTL